MLISTLNGASFRLIEERPVHPTGIAQQAYEARGGLQRQAAALEQQTPMKWPGLLFETVVYHAMQTTTSTTPDTQASRLCKSRTFSCLALAYSRFQGGPTV